MDCVDERKLQSIHYVLQMAPLKEEKMPGNTYVEFETPRILLPSFRQLVDRNEQLVKFCNILDQISRQDPVSSDLFEWYGCTGIGKSMVVKNVAKQCETI